MPRVLVTPSEMIFQQTPGRTLLEQAGFEVVFPPPGINLYDEDRLIRHLPGVDAMLAGMEPLSKRVLEVSQLRAIARFGVGYDAVDVAAARKLGIAVAITPGVNQVSAAEHTMALLLAVFRQILPRDAAVRDGSWKRPWFPRLAGKTLGLIGLGRIGKEVVPRAQAFGLQVIAFDPFPDTNFTQRTDVPLLSLNEVLRQSDIVSLHLPCSESSRKMINRESLTLMRDGAVLINTARGGLVDEPALVNALQSGKLWAAGLDAFDVEPPGSDNPLLQLPNVVLTPHTAGLDDDSVAGMGTRASEWLVKLYQGGTVPADSLVSPESLSDWTW